MDISENALNQSGDAANLVPPILLSKRYKVLNVLGDGGFGKTFLVEDTQMPSNKQCVLKQLKPIHDETPQLRQMIQDRFEREAATLETLGEAHDQIPRLYAYFQEADQFYLVEEWVEGMTLAQKVQREGPQNEKTVQTVVANLLPVIACIHSKGIVHRDIKPDNIILRQHDSKPVLIDFGAVKETMNTVVDSQAYSTRSIVVGTPGYMPTEQLAGRPVFASDIYSVGMTAIYMLTGKLPQELASDPQTGQLLWREHAPNLSADFANFLDCAIHVSTQSRFPTVPEMQSILNTVMMAQMGPQAPAQGGSSQLPNNPPQSAQTVLSALPTPSSANTTVVAPAATANQTLYPSGQYPTGQYPTGQMPAGMQSAPQPASQSQLKSALIIGSIVGISILLGTVVLVQGLPLVLAGNSNDSADSTAEVTEPTPEATEALPEAIKPETVQPTETVQPAAPPRAPAGVPNANATVAGTSGTKNIRAGAGTNFNVVDSVPVGSRIKIVGNGKDSGGFRWYRVAVPSGASGWIAAQLIQIDGDIAPPAPTSSSQTQTPPKPTTPQTNATIVSQESGPKNIRSGPGTNYGVRHTALVGDRVLIRSSSQDSGGFTWYKIYFPNSGAEGWIAAQLLKLD